MPTFLVISRHSPENCNTFNEKARKATLELMGKLDGLLKKHGVKRVGAWVVLGGEHLNFMVFEAPSLEAFQKFSMEPEVRALNAYNTNETKIAMTIEESMKLLTQAKQPRT